MVLHNKYFLALFVMLAIITQVYLQNAKHSASNSDNDVKVLEKKINKKPVKAKAVDGVKKPSTNKKAKTIPKKENEKKKAGVKKEGNVKKVEEVKKVEKVKKPNIVFILVDDVGYADFDYNTPGKSPIPTPHIDALAEEGIKLSTHYAHPTCTPSRAALMTGRYSANTGLPFAMYPGSVAGLPPSMPTMPQLMRKAGYSAHMVGKWHLGHSQPKQGPIGRGFESHTGTQMWDIESYTKLMWNVPWKQPFGADWVQAHQNGTYRHFAEPRHATLAITSAAVSVVEAQDPSKPLLLYVSYNAAHSPLQPEPSWEPPCRHIQHLWRRQYCAMVVGLDLAIHTVAEAAREKLGDDTVLVVSSDNGGSVWFGGLNAPLRSGKHASFEGGVRVPAFTVDMSGGKYFGSGGKLFNGMVHISDWLPTFLSLSGSSDLYKDLKLDGVDQTDAFKSGKEVRKNVLLELYTEKDSHNGKNLAAYRKGKYKVIQGSTKDPHWYTEPTQDRVSTTDNGNLPRFLEYVARLMDWLFGEGRCDNFRMLLFNIWLFNHYAAESSSNSTLLFDLEKDPEETTNIAWQFKDVVNDLLKDVAMIREGRPRTPKYWLVSHNWTKGFQPGDCKEQDILLPEYCRFTNSWLPDDADLEDEVGLGLEDVAANANQEIALYAVVLVVTVVGLVVGLCRLTTTRKLKKN